MTSNDNFRINPGIDPLKVEMRPIDSLKPAARNARKHSKKQVTQIAASIDQFGFINPILVDANGVVVAGHGRLAAARQLGLTDVPVIPVAHLTPDELRAYALADNRIAELSSWDESALKLHFEELGAIDLNFDIGVTGFSTTQIDLLTTGATKKNRDNDAPPDVATGRVWIERGDLWTLGEHRLLCGDSRDPASFDTLMGTERARMVFSDPPYNVKVDGHVGGLGAVKHAEFAMASGEMSKAEFTIFLRTVFENMERVSLNGAIHYHCMDWRHVDEMMRAGHAVYNDLKNVCVWVKDNGGMGSFYRSQHEFVFVWKVGDVAHLNNVELGGNGRYRTNVWEYPGASKTGDDADLAMHPTVKPVPMIMDAILDTSRKGEIVLDAFGGSGSTLIAAQKTRRRARLIEFEPKYCDVTIRRWEALTGTEAVLDKTGETRGQVCARREADHAFDVATGLVIEEAA